MQSYGFPRVGRLVVGLIGDQGAAAVGLAIRDDRDMFHEILLVLF